MQTKYVTGEMVKKMHVIRDLKENGLVIHDTEPPWLEGHWMRVQKRKLDGFFPETLKQLDTTLS